MRPNRCPDDERLIRYVDHDLSSEDAAALEEHLQGCAHCRAGLASWQELCGDLPVRELPSFERGAHVRAVMERISQPMAAKRSRARRLLRWALAASLAAAGAIVLQRGITPGAERFQARGGAAPATIARDVGVQPYASAPALRPLTPGETIAPDTPLTAGYRNLGTHESYLLLFAVDAAGSVHWITPRYERADEDPSATVLPVSFAERLLPTTVQFDDLSPGVLRILSVITPAPSHVSDIERLEGSRDAATISARLPHAEIRELSLNVSTPGGVKP